MKIINISSSGVALRASGAKAKLDLTPGIWSHVRLKRSKESRRRESSKVCWRTAPTLSGLRPRGIEARPATAAASRPHIVSDSVASRLCLGLQTEQDPHLTLAGANLADVALVARHFQWLHAVTHAAANLVDVETSKIMRPFCSYNDTGTQHTKRVWYLRRDVDTNGKSLVHSKGAGIHERVLVPTERRWYPTEGRWYPWMDVDINGKELVNSKGCWYSRKGADIHGKVMVPHGRALVPTDGR
ncbi:hypothetical protein J6590_015402 [Homalodisca vitripennis]|nr:hypothetical protein J6590_015402 [Homalodisca vitripennis]